MKIATSKKGTALMIVMCIIGILLIAGISITQFTNNAAYTVNNIHDSEEALSIAEAGVADTIGKMTTNYVYWIGRTNASAFADGSFSVKITSAGNNVLLTSTGTYNNKSRTVVIKLLGTIYDAYDNTIGVDGCIVSGGNTTLETAALSINGTVHANGNIYHSKGNTVINGDVSSCGVIQVKVASGKQKLPGVAPVVVPDYRPFDSWKALAMTNGIYYPSDTVLAGVTLSPSNGIIYVDGNVEISNRSTINGHLIASGNITINNRLKQTPYNTNWPCMLSGGDISLFNRNSYYGIIWAANNITLRNRRQITGALIALNDVLIENASTIDPLNHLPAWSPDDTNNSPPSIIVGGWLK